MNSKLRGTKPKLKSLLVSAPGFRFHFFIEWLNEVEPVRAESRTVEPGGLVGGGVNLEQKKQSINK